MTELGFIRRSRNSSRRRSPIRRMSRGITRSKRRSNPIRRPISRPVQKMRMFRPTLNQRKPQVSLVKQKPKVIARQRMAAPYRKPTIFSQKTFRIRKPRSRYTRTTRRPSILMKYNRPRVDYSARYRNEASKNRALRTALSKQKAEAKLANAKHSAEGKVWSEEKQRYNRSPGYVYDKFADELTKRYSKATKIISPSINGIGGTQENLSWAGAGLLGLLVVGVIIGRVE